MSLEFALFFNYMFIKRRVIEKEYDLEGQLQTWLLLSPGRRCPTLTARTFSSSKQVSQMGNLL